MSIQGEKIEKCAEYVLKTDLAGLCLNASQTFGAAVGSAVSRGLSDRCCSPLHDVSRLSELLRRLLRGSACRQQPAQIWGPGRLVSVSPPVAVLLGYAAALLQRHQLLHWRKGRPHRLHRSAQEGGLLLEPGSLSGWASEKEKTPDEPWLASCRGAGPPCPSSSRRFRRWGRSSSTSLAFATSPCTTTRPIPWWAGPDLRSGGQTWPTPPWWWRCDTHAVFTQTSIIMSHSPVETVERFQSFITSVGDSEGTQKLAK